jgi:hypothetical protein
MALTVLASVGSFLSVASLVQNSPRFGCTAERDLLSVNEDEAEAIRAKVGGRVVDVEFHNKVGVLTVECENRMGFVGKGSAEFLLPANRDSIKAAELIANDRAYADSWRQYNLFRIKGKVSA